MNESMIHSNVKKLRELKELVEEMLAYQRLSTSNDEVASEENAIGSDSLSYNFFGIPVKTTHYFEEFEQMTAEIARGIVMPRNQEGYDVFAEGYKYQIKYANETMKKGYGCWEFDFRLTQNADYTPDFCILYGIAKNGTISCFMIPYEKALDKISFRLNGRSEGRINASTALKSWIWDWQLRDATYESFIARRNELDRYRQLFLLQ